MVKYPSAKQETQVWSLGQEDPLEKEMATHSSILAWRIPDGLWSIGSKKSWTWLNYNTEHLGVSVTVHKLNHYYLVHLSTAVRWLSSPSHRGDNRSLQGWGQVSRVTRRVTTMRPARALLLCPSTGQTMTECLLAWVFLAEIHTPQHFPESAVYELPSLLMRVPCYLGKLFKIFPFCFSSCG